MLSPFFGTGRLRQRRQTSLRQAFDRVGARMPQMQLTSFEVHNRYP
jgi:hypothetical protein